MSFTDTLTGIITFGSLYVGLLNHYDVYMFNTFCLRSSRIFLLLYVSYQGAEVKRSSPSPRVHTRVFRFGGLDEPAETDGRVSGPGQRLPTCSGYISSQPPSLTFNSAASVFKGPNWCLDVFRCVKNDLSVID